MVISLFRLSSVQKTDDKKIIEQKISNITSLGQGKLPSVEKTAGSFFKNINLPLCKIPTGYLITKLKESTSIESCSNIKLYKKHDNIVINDGKATHTELTHFVEKIQTDDDEIRFRFEPLWFQKYYFEKCETSTYRPKTKGRHQK